MFEIERIIITGQMPESCDSCQYHTLHYGSAFTEECCEIMMQELLEGEGKLQRPPWCPLELESED